MSIIPISLGAAIDIPAGSNNGYLVSTPARLDGKAGWTFTALMWMNFDTTLGNRRILRRNGTSGNLSLSHANGNLDDLEWGVGRVTTNSIAITSSDKIITGKWLFIAVRYDETNGCDVFYGDEEVACVESSYVTHTVGVGNTWDGSAQDLQLFQRDGSLRVIDGRCAYMHLINRALTEAEMVQIQFEPGLAVANTEALYYPGADSAITPLKDYSGKGNTAVRQGSGQAIGVGAPVGWHQRRRSGLYVPLVAASVPVLGIADFNFPVPTITGESGHKIADFNLPVITITGIGDVPIAGVADFNLPTPTITGVGTTANFGSADFNLPVPTITGIGIVPRTGIADFGLPVLTIDGAGAVLVRGVADFNLPFGLTAIGDVPIDGIADFNLPIITITGFGDVPRTGIADFNLPFAVSARGTTTGVVTTLGDAILNLPRLWLDTQGRIDVHVVNIFSVTGQTGAVTGTAVALQRQAGAFFVNRDVLAQIVLGAGSATINVEASLDGGSTFTNIIAAATASQVASFQLPPLIRVRLSAATGATVNVFLDADLVAVKTDH